jgi:hypothetical protein
MLDPTPVEMLSVHDHVHDHATALRVVVPAAGSARAVWDIAGPPAHLLRYLAGPPDPHGWRTRPVSSVERPKPP